MIFQEEQKKGREMKITKVGMRTVKTVIAVILTLIVGELFQIRSPLIGSFAAIMTMESSISESFSTGINRIYGTILGGIVALIAIFISPGNYIVLGFSLIVIINISNHLSWKRATRISMTVFLIIFLQYEAGDGLAYILNRTFDTLIGVVIGTATNYFIRPPDMEKKVLKAIDNMFMNTKKSLVKLIWRNDFNEFDGLKENIIKVTDDYKTFQEDLKFYIGKTDNSEIYFNIFDSFERIESHISVIQYIKDQPIIDESNKTIIEDYFKKNPPVNATESLDELDLIYNYHLKRIIEKLQNIENIINKTHKS